jgi:hypothetical protein
VSALDPDRRGLSTFLRRALVDVNRHQVSADELGILIELDLVHRRLFTRSETIEKRVPQIAVFTYHCAPAGSSGDALMEAARFLYGFFLLNDHSSGSSDHDGFIDEWLQSLSTKYGASTETFLASFATYRRSLERETQWESDKLPATLANYTDRRAGRYQWVATSPYIDLWALTSGALVDPDLRPLVDPLKDIAVELTYIANDIGSVARDQTSKNYVWLLLREQPELSGLDDALELAGNIYAQKLSEFRERAELLPPRVRDGQYLYLLADIIDGNRNATASLARIGSANRYSPQQHETLNQLPVAREILTR